MEEKSDGTIRLSEHETEILTKALQSAIEELPISTAMPSTDFSKREKSTGEKPIKRVLI